MNKIYLIAIRILPFIAVTATIGLIYNSLIFMQIYPRIVQFEEIPSWTDRSMFVVGLSLMTLLFYHIFGLLIAVYQILKLQKMSFIRGALLFIVVISSILVVSNLPILSDIGNQYEHRLDTQGEWDMIFFNHGFHFLTGLLLSLSIHRFHSKIRNLGEAEQPEQDEVLFMSLNYIGFFSGLIGVFAIASLIVLQFPLRYYEQAINVLSFICLVPYLLSLGGWLLKHAFTSPVHFICFDEKQLQDVGKSALLTIWVLIPLMALIQFLLGIFLDPFIMIHSYFWIFLFSLILIHSGFTIRFSGNV